MQSLRRSSLIVVAAVLAVLTGNAPAFAGPAPLIEPEPGSGTGTVDTSSSSSSFFDGWVQIGLAVLVAAVVVAVLVPVVSRVRHHAPSAA